MMTKRPPPIYVRLMMDVARSFAEVRRVPSEQLPQFVDDLVRCSGGVLSQQFGGETVRFRAPRTPSHERLAKRLRIAAALRVGEPPAVIARREGVHLNTVKNLKKTKIAP